MVISNLAVSSEIGISSREFNFLNFYKPILQFSQINISVLHLKFLRKGLYFICVRRFTLRKLRI